MAQSILLVFMSAAAATGLVMVVVLATAATITGGRPRAREDSPERTTIVDVRQTVDRVLQDDVAMAPRNITPIPGSGTETLRQLRLLTDGAQAGSAAEADQRLTDIIG